MKKSLTKLLARMAKDGGTEAVAEFIEEMLEENAGEAPQQESVSAEEPVTVEVPENREITIDEETLGGILGRLDELVALLKAALEAPVPAADGDPAEEIAEAAEEVAEVMEEVLGGESDTDPGVSETLEETASEDCGDPDPDMAKDALRAALRAVRPAIAKMPPAKRRKVSAEIAANLRAARGAADRQVYSALSAGRPAARNLQDLGRRIMASRNANYHK